MFLKIDNFLFDRVFQKFSLWFQSMFGQNCFWLAKITAGLMWSSLIFCESIGLIFAVNAIVLGLTMLGAICHLWFIDKYDRNFCEIQTGDQYFLNICRIDRLMFVMRLNFLANLLWITIILTAVFSFSKSDFFYFSFLLLTVIHIFAVCTFYFIACTPLPPAKGKVKAWIEKFRAKLILAPQKVQMF